MAELVESPLPTSLRVVVLGGEPVHDPLVARVFAQSHARRVLNGYGPTECTVTVLRARVREEKITRTALIFVGRVFGETTFRDSRLYAPDFAHVLRNAGKKKTRAQP